MVAFVEVDDLERQPDGTFSVVLSAREHAGAANWIRLDPDTTSMMLRQIFWDRARETPAALRIERIDANRPCPAARPRVHDAAFSRVLGMIRGTNQIMFDFADRFRLRPNELLPGDIAANERLQGIPPQQIAAGWWELGPEQAAVIDFTPPKCRYWSFTLSNYWGQSFEYATRPHARERARRARARGRLGTPRGGPPRSAARGRELARHRGPRRGRVAVPLARGGRTGGDPEAAHRRRGELA